jgi:[NiFe] hydrogenase diaphorase moiety large subunit
MTETDLIDTVLDRHRRDGTRLVQILREIQEQLNWLSPATLTRHRRRHRLAARHGQRHRLLLQLLPHPAARQVLRALVGQHHRPHAGQCRPDGCHVQEALAGTRSRFRRRPGQREHHLLHRHVRPGSGGAGELPRRDAHDPGPAGRNGRPDPQQTPVAEWPAEWFAVKDNIRRKDILLGHDLVPGRRWPRRWSAARKIRWTGSRTQSCAVAAVPAFPPARNGKPAATPPAAATTPRTTSSAMPTRASPAPSRTACCSTSYTDLVFEGMSIAGLVVGAQRA